MPHDDFTAMLGMSDRGATDALGGLGGLVKSQGKVRFMFPQLWPEAGQIRQMFES